VPAIHDFVLEFDGSPGQYRLHVSSLAGEETADIEFDPVSLDINLDTLQAQVLATALKSRSLVPELERPIRRIGRELFELIFPAPVRALFLSSRNEAERSGNRLRIVLRLRPPELAILPWELLFSDDYGGYLCRRSPMIRYVDVPEPVRPLEVSAPLRLLVMTALPGNLARLDADEERRKLASVLAPLQDRGLVAIEWISGQSWEAAQDALYSGCHIFHFIGHGGFDEERGEGAVAFADEGGRSRLIPASALADLLSVADPAPRLVVLNSCQTAVGTDADVFSSTAATLIRTVPAVIAMQFAVTDGAATVFSRALYQALVHNRGIDEAVRGARIALTGWNSNSLEWVTPVLYLRSRETRLFDFYGAGLISADGGDRPRLSRDTVLAKYWATRQSGDWKPVVAQLGILRQQFSYDVEVEEAYQDACLADLFAQGRSAEDRRDWAEAVSHYQAVAKARPGYRDVEARLSAAIIRRSIATLQGRLRIMFAAGEFQAVVGIADRLAELDPAAADPDGLTSQARHQLNQPEEKTTRPDQGNHSRSAGYPELIPLPVPAKRTSPAENVVQVTEETFNDEVVERSKTIPVIIDLWAEWCGPCEQLSPVLERLAREAAGDWVLARVDVDGNPRLAQALQVQSIPMVVAVISGQLVDGFLGALPEAEVKKWISQVVAAAQQLGAGPGGAAGGDGQQPAGADQPGPADSSGSGPSNPAYAEAQEAMQRGDMDAAADAFRRMLAESPADPVAKVGLARVDLFRRLDSYDETKVRRAAARHPDDAAAQGQVADIEMGAGRVEEAFDRLLGLVRRTSGEQRDLAQRKLIGLFDIFPPQDPRVKKARGQLSSLLF
jgi:thioredoxin